MATNQLIQTHPVIKLEDYRVTDFLVKEIKLDFSLHETSTTVKSTLTIESNPAAQQPSGPLVLHGEALELVSVTLDGKSLGEDQYMLTDESLTLQNVPGSFVLEIVNKINPLANTSLNGLYVSGGNFCTQCEAEGFRRITYMYDRPDVLAKYTTRVEAEKEKYPMLLSNGNLVGSGESGDKHWAVWQDPFPKPTYLFALVAGDLACIEDKFVTLSGREVALHIYVQHHNKDKCDHAMKSLINAMRWDEEVYGREYDLDIYMIVAVDDFNMGAMENKGLNVFNSKCVLAKPETATDSDYQSIEGVIGHEYFHNWSGNRVTCRDWFQLSLKEGFTVFRDQEFSADMTSHGVKRISEVNVLRTHQFREDAGPMAHAVRPDSYVEINNFYTVTVYNKGAEVVRMLSSMLGKEGFRRGTDLYFERHDGQAVTTEDFVRALEDANDADFSQFRNWYSQAGTPELKIDDAYDIESKIYTLYVEQSCPATPGQPKKEPFHIPLAVGLLDKDGNDMPLQMANSDSPPLGTMMLQVTETKQAFLFQNIASRPIPSVLRGFSAPVKINIDLTRQQRGFLMAHDSDDFNRWDAGQQLAVNVALDLLANYKDNKTLELNAAYIDAVRNVLLDSKLDKALAAQAITVPSESYIADAMDVIDPVAVFHVREFMCRTISASLKDVLLKIYDRNNTNDDYSTDQLSVGKRALKNCCLSYLMKLNDEPITTRCVHQFENGNNMTDVISALAQLNNIDSEQRQKSLEGFYEKWQHDSLVIDKWFSIQAISNLHGTLDKVKLLCDHPAFSMKNPNKIRALIGAFVQGNSLHFHAQNGEGYEFLTEKVLELNQLNPQIAARLVGSFGMWRRYDEKRQGLMTQQLESILAQKNLSNDVYELVSKSLN